MSHSPILYFGKHHKTFFSDLSLSKRVIPIQNEKEFSKCIHDLDQEYLCSIMNLPMMSYPLVQNVKLLRSKRPMLPLFVIGNKSHPEESIRKLTVTSEITPDITFENLMALVDTQNPVADSADRDEVNQVSTKGDEDFFSIKSRDLIVGHRSFFDIYIRLRPDKYIKLINKHESFDVMRLNSYLKKGVTHFYLIKEQHDRFLKYCDAVSESLLKSQNSAMDTVVNQVLLLGDQILKNFSLSGVNADNIGFAKEFLNRGMALTSKLFENDEKKRDILMRALATYEHSTAMAILGGMLTRSMKFSSAEMINSISLALLLHDVGLEMLPENLKTLHNPDFLSSDEYALYMTHPNLGYELFKDVSEIPPIVAQAVLQHHERKDRTGYPNVLSGGAINQVAEIIGICDEYIFMTSSRKIKHQAFLKDLEMKYFAKFSPQIITGFKKIFNN